MVFVHNDNFGIEDLVDSNLEDWKLPLSIEDEEAMLADRPLDIILVKAREVRDYPSGSTMVLMPDYKPTLYQSLWPKLAAPSRLSPGFETGPQSDIENDTSPLINLSIGATLTAFISPNTVVTTIVIPKNHPDPSASLPELLIRPHHFRRSSFSASPICIAEIARLREGLWNLQIQTPSVDIGEDNVDDKASSRSEISGGKDRPLE